MGDPKTSRASLATVWDLARLAPPIIVAELGAVANGVIATVIVGRLGPEAIGAVGLGNVLFGAVSVFGQGLVLGLDPLIAQAYGARRLDECRRWLTQGILLSAIAAGPLIVLLYAIAGLLPSWGIDPATASLTTLFLQVRAWHILLALLYAALRRYLQAMNLARPIAVVIVAHNLIHLLAALVLVHGGGPLPALGAVGIAWAALIAGAVAASSSSPVRS